MPNLKTLVVFDVGQVLITWDPRHLYRTRSFEGGSGNAWPALLPSFAFGRIGRYSPKMS
jgi:hypothetical protein